MKKRLSAVALLTAIAMPLAVPARALAFKFGDEHCTPPYVVGMRSYSTGITQHEITAPGPRYTTGLWSNGPTWRVRYSESNHTYASWFISTNGLLQDAGTYGYCTLVI